MAADYTKVNESIKYCNTELYEECSEELNVNISLVREVVSANSEFIKETVQRGGFESIILPYLGKIKAKLRSVQKATGKIHRP
jgi:hypothetical protein